MVGQLLGHYRILEQIGAGGMGVVYRAHDERLDRDVALKVLPAGTLADEATRKRFRKEALALSKLNHPNIETVHDFGTQDGVDFLVMEYIPGVTLSDRVSAGPLPEKEILKLGTQLAEGLAAAHEQNIVHRDLKPGNLRIMPDGRLKILDFGLAKLARPFSEVDVTASVTETHAVAGTLPYMAPEQLQGAPVDARTDIYAAGVVLYELATGKPPFQDRLPTALSDAILHKPAPPPSRLRLELSSRLEEIVLKCLEKDPESRYQSAKELGVDLRRLAAPSTAPTVSVPSAVRLIISTKAIVLGTALLLVLAVAAALYFTLRPAHALSATDFILLADFVNTTGDPIFDDTLKRALAVKLGESPFLNIFPESRVRETLRQMKRSPDEQVTADVGREICERQSIKALLAGHIAPLGSHYVITLDAVESRTGESLARQQVEAGSKEEVLAVLGKAASKLRGKLGESLKSIAKFDTPLLQATTSSLEALKAFSLGQRRIAGGMSAEAIPYLKRAIELDPDFALAHRAMASVYNNLGQSELATESSRRAFALRERATEREKFSISGQYYWLGTRELDKALTAFQLYKEAYPRDPFARTYLGAIIGALGSYEKAVEEEREAVRVSPNYSIGYNNLTLSYISLNRLEEAKATLEQAREWKLPIAYEYLYRIAFAQNDAAAMEQAEQKAKGTPREQRLVSAQAEAAEFLGKLRQAKEFYRQGIRLAQRDKQEEVEANSVAGEALTEATFGNFRQARQKAAAALSLWPFHSTQKIAALALALAGDVAQAQALSDKLARDSPTDTLLNAVFVPTVRAALELQRGNPRRAIELLEAATPYELGRYWTFCAIYIRGQAYLRAGAGEKAAAEFQKILDHRGVGLLTSLYYPLSNLGLARAYALTGDKAKSRKAYEDFLAVWKDADPDIPTLKEAKAEYAKLK